MLKLSWGLTIAGLLAIVSSVLYPLGIIDKQVFLAMLVSGAFTMFVGSMVRTYAILKKK